MNHPRLRPVEVFPVQEGGREWICLRDPSGMAAQPLFLDRHQFFFVSRMDGSNSLRDLQADYCRATGDIVPMEQIEALARQLDELHYLDSPDFRTYAARLAEEFRARTVRLARHAGAAYPDAPEELRRQLDGYFTPPDGPGPACGQGPPRLRGIIAPHIDFQRGGPTYAHAYKSVAEHADADVFIVFGTCHNPMRRRFALTAKDFATPLGTVPADRGLVERLARDLQADVFEDEFAHRDEHSIEFQAVFLRYVFGDRKPVRMVPILVGSFQGTHGRGGTPLQNPEVREMVEALRRTIGEAGESCCLVAGADLAHVGRRFGDAVGPTESMLQEVERRDREFLELVASGDAEGAARAIAADDDRRRVCGYPPIYMLLHCLEQPRGKLLQYRQWADFRAGAAVTFAALAVF